MECVEGRTLQAKLDRDGPLPAAEVLRIGQQIAFGLAAAHGRGLVHRDIKPANVLLEGTAERVKVTDFGLARAADDVSITRSGVIAGTPQYMSPEQVNGGRVGPASDLFSLGSLLFALCAGHPPFRAPSLTAVLKLVGEGTPPPLRGANPAVPRRLDAVIRRLLAKSPDDRFASAAEVGEVLGQLRADLLAGKNLDLAPRRRSRILGDHARRNRRRGAGRGRHSPAVVATHTGRRANTGAAADQAGVDPAVQRHGPDRVEGAPETSRRTGPSRKGRS